MDVHCSLGICTPIPSEASPVAGVVRLGRITPEWHRARMALLNPLGHNIAEIHCDGMAVDTARNFAVQKALDEGIKYLFFLDWDTIPPREALCRLVYHLDNHPDCDVAAGLYCSKSQPPWPLLWREWGNGVSWDFALGDVLTENVVGVPMGCTLLRVDLFRRLPHTPEKPWFKTTVEPLQQSDGAVPQLGTEDLWFCQRFGAELHGKILMDTGILCEHIEPNSGLRFTLPDDCLPRQRAAEKLTAQKTLLHIGCGPIGTAPLPAIFDAKHWREIRVDLDPAAKPNVLASLTDLRAFAAGSAAAVYSSHTLEHLPAHEVPLALSEIYRVLEPGAVLYLALPDLEAVAEAIVAGKLESPAYESPAGTITPRDVVFGYSKFIATGNTFQQHKTGFTAATLRDKLTAAGFDPVDVERQTAAFALFATATKPRG